MAHGGSQPDLGDFAGPSRAGGYPDDLYGGEIHDHVVKADPDVAVLRVPAQGSHGDSCLP